MSSNIVSKGTMKAVISAERSIMKANISAERTASAHITIPDRLDADVYDGETEVTPIFADITLKTAGKAVKKDILVESIPVRSATNLSGGYTVTIGGYM